jgi:hypothetical protein
VTADQSTLGYEERVNTLLKALQACAVSRDYVAASTQAIALASDLEQYIQARVWTDKHVAQELAAAAVDQINSALRAAAYDEMVYRLNVAGIILKYIISSLLARPQGGPV